MKAIESIRARFNEDNCKKLMVSREEFEEIEFENTKPKEKLIDVGGVINIEVATVMDLVDQVKKLKELLRGLESEGGDAQRGNFFVCPECKQYNPHDKDCKLKQAIGETQ